MAGIPFSLRQDYRPEKKTSSSPNQFSMSRMRKLSSISMWIRANTVVVMIAISPCPLNDMEPHIMNEKMHSLCL